MDLNTLLLNNLGAPTQQIAAEDPYAQFQGLGQQIIQQSVGAQNASTGQKLAGAILGGLGGGLFGGLSDNYRARAADAYNQALLGQLTGTNLEKPDVLTDSIFQSAKQKASIFNLARQLEARELAGQQQAALGQLAAKSAVDLANKKDEMILANPEREAEIEALFARRSGVAPIGEAVQKPKNEYQKLYDELGNTKAAEFALTKKIEQQYKEPEKDWITKVPEAVKTRAFQAISLGGELDNLKEQFSSLEQSVPAFQASKNISGTKAFSLMNNAKILLPSVVRSLGDSGALSDTDMERAQSIISGNITSSPQNIGSFLSDLSSRLKTLNKGVLESAKTAVTGGGDALMGKFTAPIGPGAPMAGATITPEQARAMLRAKGVPGY